MQVDLTDEQFSIVTDLLHVRIREIHPASRRSVYAVHDEPKYDLEVLQELLQHLQNTQRSERTRAAWEGYAETREVPSNPPPGSCAT